MQGEGTRYLPAMLLAWGARGRVQNDSAELSLQPWEKEDVGGSLAPAGGFGRADGWSQPRSALEHQRVPGSGAAWPWLVRGVPAWDGAVEVEARRKRPVRVPWDVSKQTETAEGVWCLRTRGQTAHGRRAHGSGAAGNGQQ